MWRRRVALGVALVVAGVLTAAPGAWAQGVRPDMSPGSGTASAARPALRPPIHRPRPVFRPPFAFFPCCADSSYFPDPAPPVYAPAPPPIVYVVPTPPALVYVPPARVEPAPEIKVASGQWERHGNGKEYPYTWVWQPAYSAR